MKFNYYMPTRILFGNGQVAKLNRQRMPGKKALLVTQKNLVDEGVAAPVLEQFSQMGLDYVIFDQVACNPTQENVAAGAAMARENGCDFVIGFGGGSSMDAAKAIALMASNSGEIWDYMRTGSGGKQAPANKPLPIVLIATTGGTGSEADQYAVVTNLEKHEKITYGSGNIFAKLAIVDPQLSKSVPPEFTAYQGFDALFHNAECYANCSISNYMSDMYALTAVEMVAENLPKVMADPQDSVAREKMAFASTLGGFIMSFTSTSSEHSMEHALSAVAPELPHGAGLIMLSKAYFTHLANSGKCDAQLIRLAKAMGKADASKPMDFVDALVELQKVCGVDGLKMSDYGIKSEDFMDFAQSARFLEPAMFMVERAVITDEIAASIFKESYR